MEEVRYLDEMNFAEFPLALLGSRAEGVNSLVFTDRIFDPGRNAEIERKLTILPSAELGLPNAADDEVIFGLIQLTNRQGFSSRTVTFSRYELIRLLGWGDESTSYERIKDSLFRWLGVTLKYEKSWWSREDQLWVDKGFHILEDVQLLDRRGAKCGSSSFTWNETVFRSFKEGYLRKIDFNFYRSLRSDVAKRMFRFLDKKFYLRKALEFPLRTFAHDHIGVSRCYANGELKRLLRRPIRELEEKGFLESGEFVKEGRGEWKVCFQRALDDPNPTAELPVDSGLIQQLVALGVARRTAAKLVADYPAERIQRQLDQVRQIKAGRNGTVIRNVPGYLVKAIRDDFAPGSATVAKARKAPASETKASPMLPSPDELAERRTLDAAWSRMSAEEQFRFEAEAVALAEGFLRKQYRSGEKGSLFQTVRRKILDDHLRRTMSAG